MIKFSFYKNALDIKGEPVLLAEIIKRFNNNVLGDNTSVYRLQYLPPAIISKKDFEEWINPFFEKWNLYDTGRKELAKLKNLYSRTKKKEILSQIELQEAKLQECGEDTFIAKACVLEDIYNARKDAADNYKKKNFPAVTWSGTFQKRAASALLQHTGLICIDIDKLTTDQHDALKNKLKIDPYVFILFTSPSGNGLKIIIKISNDATQHLLFFNDLQKYFQKNYRQPIDVSGKDVSRLCFLAADPGYYHNPDSITYPTPDTPPAEPKPFTPKEEKDLTNAGSLEEIFRFTERRISYMEGQRTTFINVFAWNCNLRGISREDCLDYVLTNLSDHPEGQSKATVNSLYNNKITDHAKFKKGASTGRNMGADKINSPQSGTTKTGAGDADLQHKNNRPGAGFATNNPGGNGNIQPQPHGNGIGEHEAVTFWTERKVTRGKGENKFQAIEYDLKKVRFVNWLFQQGFFVLTDKEGTYQLCHANGNIIDVSDPFRIKQFVFYWCETNVIEDIYEMVRQKTRLFAMDELTGLKSRQFQFKRDTAEESFFYFSNCWVSVSAGGITTHNYNSFTDYIWAKQQKDHAFTLQPPTFFNKIGNLDPAVFNSEFAQFVYYVGYNPNNPDEKSFTQEQIGQRFASFCSAIGYMLDGYKHPANRKAIFAIDHKIGTDKNEKHGGTGKSIIPKACGHLKIVSTINGDEFNPNYQFRFEPITADSQIINFNDMPDRFDPFELFTVIADDYTVTRRNNGHLFFRYENSAKVWYSTNSVPRGDGSSYARRMFILEFSDFFTPENTPFDFFGHGLFSSAWSEAEWNNFYNFMLYCVQSYKHDELIPYPNSNLNERRLKNEVSVELIDYLDELPRDRRSDKKPWLEGARKVLQEANGGGKPLTANSFNRYVKRYCQSNGLFFNPHIPHGKFDKSGGIEYYTIATTPDFKAGEGGLFK